MPDLLSLTSDFFERMANPAYGIAVNDEYALRLAALLEEQRTESFLAREAENLSDPDALTAHGWLWFLSYARARSLRLSGDLLLRLAERWSSISMLVAVIDTATQDEERAAEWLEILNQRMTTEERPEERLPEKRDMGEREGAERMPERDITVRAESLLVALLQTGNEPSLRAATDLLHRQWRGNDQLTEFFWSLGDELDDGTRQLWIDRLSPPSRRRDHDHGE